MIAVIKTVNPPMNSIIFNLKNNSLCSNLVSFAAYSIYITGFYLIFYYCTYSLIYYIWSFLADI